MTNKQKIVSGALWLSVFVGVALLTASGLESVWMMWVAAFLLGFAFGGLAAYDAWGFRKMPERHLSWLHPNRPISKRKPIYIDLDDMEVGR